MTCLSRALLRQVTDRLDEQSVAAIFDALRLIFEPYEARRKARSKPQQEKFKATGRELTEEIVLLAMQGRGWLRISLANGYLKRRDGPGICFRAIVKAMEAASLIEVRLGYLDRKTGVRRRTMIRAMPYLRALMAEHGFTPSHSELPTVTTVLNGKKADLTPSLMEADAVIRRFNAVAAQGRLTMPQSASPPDVYLVRKLKGGVNCGGRLFGGWWQYAPKADRPAFLIDGEPVAELDFKAMQPRILFALEGKQMDFDPYVVPGANVDREAGKLAYHLLVNGKPKKKSNRKCPLNYQGEFTDWFLSKESFHSFMERLQDRLSPIAHHFGPDAWKLLQFEESELAIAIIATCLAEGIMVYPIHDSFIVKDSDKETVDQIMKDEFHKRYGVSCEGGISGICTFM